jgi:acetolactate synthase small subunit
VARRVACFSIHAEAAPGVMPRVLQLFAKRNLVPSRWHSDRIGPGGRELAIDLQVQGLSPDLTDYIARCLRQLHDVETVLTSEKTAV